eukprot:scaffold32564_cov43-Cyclotella_meneghiniana.AAC.1
MEHNNAQASDSKEVSKEVAAAIQDASAVAPTENPADAPNKASSPSTTGSASAAASVAPNQQSAGPTSTATASVAASAAAIAQKSAATESTATSSVPATGYAAAAAAAAEVAPNQKSVAASSTATASAPPTELKEAAAAAASRGFHDDGSRGNADPPSCSTPMTSNKTSPPLANNQLYSPQQPFFAPQPFQPIINHPAAVANQSPPRMRITQTQYSPAFSPRSPNIDIQSYQHSIRAKLNDPNNHHSTFEEVITHPSHPFGKQFWELAMKNTYLPNEFLGFDLLLDVFPMVYTILSNLQLGLIPKTNGGLNLNRSTHKNVDIMHVLPHTINKLVDNKVFRHLHSSSGGDGGGEDPDDGDDGGFDDLSSDEEDPDEKIHPGEETNMTLGYRESTKVQIKLSLSSSP